MPTYLGQPVSDKYLDLLKEAYREGFKAEGKEADASDAPIVARLEAEQVVVPGLAPTAYELGRQDAQEALPPEG